MPVIIITSSSFAAAKIRIEIERHERDADFDLPPHMWKDETPGAANMRAEST